MRKTLVEEDILLAEGIRLIRRLWKVKKDRNFPQGLEFAFQLLHFKNSRWIQIARIDNQMHEGSPGTHIHILGRKKVKWEDIRFQDAEQRIIEIGKRMIKNENRNC